MTVVRASHATPSGQVLRVVHGDLTRETTDAIVNAANSALAHFGGVAAAIVHRGGLEIQHASDAWVDAHGQVPTGQVAVTTAGRLPCKTVVHAVGPVWHGGDRGEETQLFSAVAQSLRKAHELGLTSIALPAISSGIFGFPKDRCATICFDAALDFCARHPDSPLREIRFTNFDEPTVAVFLAELHRRSG